MVEKTLRKLTRRALIQEQRDEARERLFRLHQLVLEYVQRHSVDLREAHHQATLFDQEIAQENSTTLTLDDSRAEVLNVVTKLYI